MRGVLLAPLFVFGGGVKRHGLGGFRFFGPGAWDTFHDGGDEDLEKIFNLQQTGPKMVEKIHNQPFDVAAVVVLVGHDHDVPVPQPRSVVVPENQSHQNKKRQCLLLLSLVATHQLHSTPRSMPHRAPSLYLHSMVGRGSSSTSTSTSTSTVPARVPPRVPPPCIVRVHVLGVQLQPHDFHDVLHFRVAQQLFFTRVTDV